MPRRSTGGSSGFTAPVAFNSWRTVGFSLESPGNWTPGRPNGRASLDCKRQSYGMPSSAISNVGILFADDATYQLWEHFEHLAAARARSCAGIPLKLSCGTSLLETLARIYKFRYSITLRFARREAARFQRGRERVEPRILVQPPVVNKVYVGDYFLDASPAPENSAS